MAEGGGVIQAPAKCQFCEDSIEVLLKCLHCDLFLCKFCTTKIHSRSKASQNHHVINIKDLGTEETARLIRKIQLDSLTCGTHEEQKCDSYCHVCWQVICVYCLKDVCKKHSTENLVQRYDTKLAEMKDKRNAYVSEIQIIEEKINDTNEIESDIRGKKDELNKTIKQREKEIKQAVSRYSQELRNQAEKIYEPIETKIQERRAFLGTKLEENIKQRNSISEIIYSEHVLDIIRSDLPSECFPCQELDIFDIKETCNPLELQFTSSKQAECALKTLFGDLKKSERKRNTIIHIFMTIWITLVHVVKIVSVLLRSFSELYEKFLGTSIMFQILTYIVTSLLISLFMLFITRFITHTPGIFLRTLAVLLLCGIFKIYDLYIER